jgi:hypothetical protein
MQEPLVAQFEFRRGAHRGTQLALYANRLVHQSAEAMEIMPLAHLAAVRIEFLRDSRRLSWAVALCVLALALFAVAGPLQSWAGTAAGEVAAHARAESPSGGVQTLLLFVFRALEAFGALLPFAGMGLAAGAATLLFYFWQGRTTLTLALAAVERSYPVPGRDRGLADFADMLGERVSQRVR